MDCVTPCTHSLRLLFFSSPPLLSSVLSQISPEAAGRAANVYRQDAVEMILRNEGFAAQAANEAQDAIGRELKGQCQSSQPFFR